MTVLSRATIKILNTVKGFEDENWGVFKKFLFSKIKRIVKDAYRLISAYTYNANMVVRSIS